ncbi:MAG: hypothetical protein ACRDYE_15460, partial [Acidimicrobiales bacterium]
MTLAALLVQISVTSDPLQQTRSVYVYSNRALEAGVNTFLAAINTNPSLAQCSTATNDSGTCSGLSYETWTQVQGSGSGSGSSDAEYYTFGNPQPTFNSVTGALNYLTVSVAGAASDPAASHHYVFSTETITIGPQNGFLDHVWWSNYESYNDSGDYSQCQYNWKNGYTPSGSCYPVYFGNDDTVNGPVYTNDSVFIDTSAGNPSFGTTAPSWPGPTSVQTADPNCLFVNQSHGMTGNSTGCDEVASTSVAACAPVSSAQLVSPPSGTATSGSSNCQDSTLLSPGSATSSFANPVEVMPAADTQLETLANQNGCLYAGPTQVTLNGGKMTVVSQDTPSSGGFSTLNDGSNTNHCPVNGTANLPANGVVYAETAPSADGVAFSNPFDDGTWSSVTNVTSSPAAAANTKFTLTATVTGSASAGTPTGTAEFTQSTTRRGRTTTSDVSGCSAQPLSGSGAT